MGKVRDFLKHNQLSGIELHRDVKDHTYHLGIQVSPGETYLIALYGLVPHNKGMVSIKKWADEQFKEYDKENQTTGD